MTAFAHKYRLRVYLDAVDEDGNVYDAIKPINEEVTVEMETSRHVRVQENNVALSAAIATGAVADGLTVPSLVAVISDQPIFVDLNNLGTATANQPKANLVIVARFDGGDCQVDSVDLLNDAAAAANVNDANVQIVSAGNNT